MRARGEGWVAMLVSLQGLLQFAGKWHIPALASTEEMLQSLKDIMTTPAARIVLLPNGNLELESYYLLGENCEEMKSTFTKTEQPGHFTASDENMEKDLWVLATDNTNFAILYVQRKGKDMPPSRSLQLYTRDPNPGENLGLFKKYCAKMGLLDQLVVPPLSGEWRAPPPGLCFADPSLGVLSLLPVSHAAGGSGGGCSPASSAAGGGCVYPGPVLRSVPETSLGHRPWPVRTGSKQGTQNVAHIEMGPFAGRGRVTGAARHPVACFGSGPGSWECCPLRLLLSIWAPFPDGGGLQRPLWHRTPGSPRPDGRCQLGNTSRKLQLRES
ncbi:lipocalin-1 [Candoia aspera]|uniref:lipocalin-1 n=1 Tax=Candoia aspera TaxID=51853 RepID=UPI002FD8069D